MPSDPEKARIAKALRYDEQDPLANLEAADELDRGARGVQLKNITPPAHGCALTETPRRIWTERAVASITAFGSGFVVAGYAQREGQERVFVLHLPSSGSLAPVTTLIITPPHTAMRVAPPGLCGDPEQGVALAFTDGAGVLFTQRLQVGSKHGGSATVELGRGVDTRFAPALAMGKRGPLIAYTLGTTPMRTMLARIAAGGAVLDTRDVTPPAMGASAPAFVSGAWPPVLITADARNGMSPIARTVFSADGNPGAPTVAAPVGMMSQPPQLTAAQSELGAWVAYTGLGSASTSAVGLVQIAPRSGSPEALIKGTAYGPLHVAAASAGKSVLFASDAPTGPGKSPAHEIELVLLDAAGKGPALRIADPSGDATRVGLARSEDGTVAVLFTGKDGLYLAKARCAQELSKNGS